ncbi:MAG: type ISP restriction/modification enzyme [bacterium]
MAFKETGFWNFHRRLGIYLTNSLEESVVQESLFMGFGFAESIAEESKEASKIKNETPIMVVIGNPPYSGVSSNETDYANGLVKKYKVEPGGKIKLQERKHWLNDDYVKFIALAEALVEKNGEGIVGFVTNHGYLDNPTFRGMRWHLMSTFDEIYVLDLHGNANKKEKTPDGSNDENVFDIKQGVAIILAVRSKSKEKVLAKIYHSELWGKREEKFKQLDNSSIASIKWTLLDSRMPSLFFVPEGSQELEEEYKTGFSVSELFPINTTGVVTMGDSFVIDQNKDILGKRVTDFLNEDVSEVILKNKFELGKNYAKWIIGNRSLISFDERKIIPILYRPFDIRYTYFDNKLVWRPRTKIMSNFIRNKNLGLIAKRGIDEYRSAPIFVSDEINESRGWSRPGMEGIESIFPLYLYSKDGSRVPNLKKEIVAEIEKIVGKVSPEDIFDYIYAVLHSPSYREKYKEFLKIDFPRVPYPKDAESFKELVGIGTELRLLHLLESPKVNQFITTYPIAGSDVIEKLTYKDNNIFINKDQYFGNVPESAWNFYIGGYQPAQKWLKDRKGHTLLNSEIEHYQKMIVALSETERIMPKIDKLLIFLR